MRQTPGRPECFLGDHADDGLRQALADGTPAAIVVARIRDEEATALHQLRALRP